VMILTATTSPIVTGRRTGARLYENLAGKSESRSALLGTSPVHTVGGPSILNIAGNYSWLPAEDVWGAFTRLYPVGGLGYRQTRPPG